MLPKGRPPHEPDEQSRKFVKFLAFKRASQAEIAVVIGLSVGTLRLHYREELDVEKDRMATYLVESGYLQAVGGETRSWKDARPEMTKFMLERFCDVVPPVAKVEQESVIRIEGGLPDMPTGESFGDDQAANPLFGSSEGLSGPGEVQGDPVRSPLGED